MKIIIVGKTASGKDYFLNEFKKLGYKVGIKYTTRPIRKNEIPGVTYYYTDNAFFIRMSVQDMFICKQKFFVKDGTWYYGLTHYEWEMNDVFIITPHELQQLQEYLDIDTKVIYLDIPEEILRTRLYNRSDHADSIERRLESDRNDFKDFNSYTYRITEQIDINTLKSIINI